MHVFGRSPIFHFGLIKPLWFLTLQFFLNLESRVILSPSGEVSVCPGGQLSFRCSTSFTFLEWNATIVLQSGRLSSRRQLVTPVSQLDLHLTINGHVFNITRNSAYDASPLISTLTVANAVADLSPTKINCTDIGSSLAETSTSLATISVIDPVLSRLIKSMILTILGVNLY